MSQVTIVGASYAGLACASELLKNGVEPTIIEAKPSPTANTTGGYAEWWLQQTEPIPNDVVAAKINGARIVSPGGVEAVIRADHDIGGIIYPEMYLQHYIEKVKRGGAHFLAPATFLRLEDGCAVCNYEGREAHSPPGIVVAADGANSAVGRFLGRPPLDPDDLHFGYEETRTNPQYDTRLVHIYLDPAIAPKGYWWIFPNDNEGREVRVGLGVPKSVGQNPKDNFYNVLLPKYWEFSTSKIFKVVGGQIPTAPTPDSNVMGRTLFVGDAGRFCSPLHGGGIGFGIMSGILAARAILAGDPSSYDKLWKTQLGKILHNHYRLKHMLYSWDAPSMDRAIRLLAEFNIDPNMDFDMNRELVRFVFYLARHDPALVPKFVKVALK